MANNVRINLNPVSAVKMGERVEFDIIFIKQFLGKKLYLELIDV